MQPNSATRAQALSRPFVRAEAVEREALLRGTRARPAAAYPLLVRGANEARQRCAAKAVGHEAVFGPRVQDDAQARATQLPEPRKTAPSVTSLGSGFPPVSSNAHNTQSKSAGVTKPAPRINICSNRVTGSGKRLQKAYSGVCWQRFASCRG